MTATAELRQAHKDGKIGVAFDPSRISPSLLSRWSKEVGVKATGKKFMGSYVVIFWGNLLRHIKGDSK